MKRRILPLILALVLVLALAVPASAADPLSFSDAEKGAVKPHLDGKEITVAQYTDVYVANSNSPEQKIAIYVPDGATKDSPIILLVNNSGWFSNSYAGANHVKNYGEEEGRNGKQIVGDYSSTTDNIGVAIDRGYVVVTYGCRGRNDAPTDGQYLGHSPATMTDTKAVIRYLRYNADLLPAGDPEKIVISGTSGGGALSTVIAASGNSSDYYQSLYEVGAAGVTKNADGTYASTIDDDVFATIAYCPINDLGHACAAYEWTFNDTRKTMYAEGTMDYTKQTGMDGKTAEWPNATQEKVMAASEALKADYAEYVNSLGLKLEDGTALTDRNLEDAIIALMEAEVRDTLAEGATPESMLADIKASDKSEGKLADWLTFDGSDFTYDYDKHLHFLATATRLKVAPAFSNVGMAVAQQNEDNLFGTAEQAYLPFNFYSWDNDATAGNGVGKDDTGLSWEQFTATDAGRDVLKQIKMTSPIPYLTSKTEGDSAPYWYVRHGVMDRDTSFALQTVLYYAMINDKSIQDVDFEFAWLQPHAGNYDVAEAYAWLADVLGETDAPEVQLSRQAVTVDGKAVSTEVYNIDGSNYFKLRDVAAMLADTGAKFSVSYDESARAISAKSGEAYTAVGGELTVGSDKSATCVVSDQSLIVNGTALKVTVYNIGGNNFFKLRDLGQALEFGVDYDAATSTVLVTTK